jgi:hypothetical protein
MEVLKMVGLAIYVAVTFVTFLLVPEELGKIFDNFPLFWYVGTSALGILVMAYNRRQLSKSQVVSRWAFVLAGYAIAYPPEIGFPLLPEMIMFLWAAGIILDPLFPFTLSNFPSLKEEIDLLLG